MLIEFEAAVLSVDEPKRPSKKTRIGWFIQAVDVNSASIRYRAFHFARVLAPQFESSYFTSVAELQQAIRTLDALIVVKRLDRNAVEVVSMARQCGIPTFLDLCDDLIAPAYPKNEHGVNLAHFLGIAPLLAGVTVPSAEMADRVQSYAVDHGLSGLSVHVIPDIAETWEVYRATYRYLTDKDPDQSPKPRAKTTASPRKQIVWFGNYGASHSNFGIFSLKPTLKSLRAVNEDIPLELVVVSNSETVYRALVYNCGFPTRFVRWSPSAVYSELAAADAALLTTGDDEFCSIKSSNRVLQAFAVGVPVIAPKHPSLSEFDEAIFSGRTEDSLHQCLGPGRERAIAPKLAAAERVLARYTPKRLARLWSSLIKATAKAGSDAASTRSAGKVLVVVEPGDRLEVAKSVLAAAKALPDVESELLVSIDLMEAQPDFTSLPRLSKSSPRFFAGKIKGGRNLLQDCCALVVERPSAPTAKLLAGFAAGLGIPVVKSADAANGSLRRFARAKTDAVPEPSKIRAGPHEERLNADGSVDWAFVVHQNARGWILDAISREIGSRQPNSWTVVYHPAPAPKAKNIFFTHYLLFENYVERRPEALEGANAFVWYTHPREEDPVSVAKRLLAFDHVTKVIFTCEANRQVWMERGLPEDKATVILGAADPGAFRFHERGRGVVGLSSSFYERKNPDCLLEVLKLLPKRQFLLLGRNWHQYALFEEMKALPNFTYSTVSYRDYPDLYATFDVFLSMSNLEGGPIPLIEAMMSNAVPVASRTGFAPDLIRHGENGFIFDLDASPSEIAKLIEAAFALSGNVRETVVQYDWDSFSASVVELAQ